MQNILNRLSKVRRYRKGFKAQCPVSSHRDTTQSLFLRYRESEEGNKSIQIKCFAGCKTKEIMDSIDLRVADLFNEENIDMTAVAITKDVDKGKKYNSVEEITANYKTLKDYYEYNELNKESTVLQIRYLDEDGNKQFATYHKEEDGFWYTGRPEGLMPIYNIDEVHKSPSVLIVEGEKVVKILKEYGICATTSLGGANASEFTDWTFLMDKPSIVIWRDNDEAGIKYQQNVQTILNNLNKKVRKVEVEKLKLQKGDDLEEFIEKQKGTKANIKKEILNVIPPYEAEEAKPVSYLRAHLEKVREGEIKNYEVPFFPMLTKTVRMFKPGSQGVIYAKGGIGKSLFVGRTADEWTLDKSARVKRLMLESSMAFHLSRSLAQQASRTDVLAEEFHYENPKESIEIVNQYEDVLNIIGESITTSDTGLKKNVSQWDDKSVVRWLEANAADNDILIVDPVSLALQDPVYVSSNYITKGAEEVMAKHPHLCIIFVHHPSEEGTISGGKAWQRFTSVNLEIIMLEEPELYEVMKMNGDIITKEITTFIKVRKCRNGSANGWKIAIELDTNDLTLKEVGRMLKKVK